MKPEQIIQDKYRSKGRIKGQELLLRHKEALQFIEDCKELKLIILGMDFYVEKDDDVVELIGASADYSSLEGLPNAVERGAAAARELIKDGLPDGADWVSFVVEEWSE